jgi:hypothetical protein
VWFEGKGVSTSRVIPPGPLSTHLDPARSPHNSAVSLERADTRSFVLGQQFVALVPVRDATHVERSLRRAHALRAQLVALQAKHHAPRTTHWSTRTTWSHARTSLADSIDCTRAELHEALDVAERERWEAPL